MTSENLNHDRISPTAKLVAYWRQFTDIPFSGDIANLFRVEDVANSFFKSSGQDAFEELLVPMLEIRYKCIQNLILKSAIKQVLEFASGISLRGLAMTQDTAMTYVETDLSGLTEEKLSFVEDIMKKNSISERKNLFFHSVNILSETEIEKALQHFDPRQPLAIVHEGLFQYLTRAEKKQAALNIHQILRRFGGMWVTPDLDSRADREYKLFNRESFRPIMDAVSHATGRDFVDNAFVDQTDIYNFFADLGFSVELTTQLNDDLKISSYKNRPMSDDIHDILKGLRLWILRVI